MLFLSRERERETRVREKREGEGYKKMRQGWEREKDRKRGMVGGRKIGREAGVEERGGRRDMGETKIERKT